MQKLLNDAAYEMETQELSIENSLRLKNLNEWEIEDRIWMQRNMRFDENVIDLQKHQKVNHYKYGGVA